MRVFKVTTFFTLLPFKKGVIFLKKRQTDVSRTLQYKEYKAIFTGLSLR